MDLLEAKRVAESDNTTHLLKWRENTKKVGRIIVFGVVAIIVTIWVAANIPRYDTDLEEGSRQSASRGESSRAAGNTSREACDREIYVIPVAERWTSINPGFRCAVVFKTIAGTVWVGEPSNYVRVTRGEDIGNALETNGVRILAVRAERGTAQFGFKRCPHGTTSPDSWECR